MFFCGQLETNNTFYQRKCGVFVVQLSKFSQISLSWAQEQTEKLLDSRFWSLHPLEFVQQVELLTGVLTWILRMRRLHNSCVSGDVLVCGGCCSGGSESIRGGVCGVRLYRNQKRTLKSLPPSPNWDLFQKRRAVHWGGRVRSEFIARKRPAATLPRIVRAPSRDEIVETQGLVHTMGVYNTGISSEEKKKSHQNVRQVFLGSR